MGLIKILQGLAFSANGIYILGHLLALIGLALEQDWCRNNIEQASGYVGLGLTAVSVGDKCHKLFRFAWFVWALCTVPLVLSLVHNVRPHLVARGSSALFAILATLQILLTNEFFNIVTLEEDGKPRRYARLTVAGFAILAIGSLLTIIFEAVTDPSKSRAEHTGGREAEYKQPAPAAQPVARV